MNGRSCSKSLQALCGPTTSHAPVESGRFPSSLQIAKFLEDVADPPPDAAFRTQGIVGRFATLPIKYSPLLSSTPTPSDANPEETVSSVFANYQRAWDWQLDKYLHLHDKIMGQFRTWGVTSVNIPKRLLLEPEHSPTSLNGRSELTGEAGLNSHGSETTLGAEQIRLLPGPIRRALWSHREPRITASAETSGSRADCVARLYLGRTGCSRCSSRAPSSSSDKCRSMNLHLMLKVGMDVEPMARTVAVSMAILHWGAKVDGRGVKFALGGSWDTASRRNIKLWLFDFHRVRPMTMDDEGVDMASQAIWSNGPYFPRPLQSLPIQKKAWNAFVTSYIAASEMILMENDSKECIFLPRLFIRRLIQHERKLGSSRDAEKVK